PCNRSDDLAPGLPGVFGHKTRRKRRAIWNPLHMCTRYRTLILAAAAVALSPAAAPAADPVEKVCRDVNTKMVKIFGAGGFQRLNSFGSGIVISPEGHILTVANPLIDNRGQTIVVHLYDGRRMKAVVLAVEREL